VKINLVGLRARISGALIGVGILLALSIAPAQAAPRAATSPRTWFATVGVESQNHSIQGMVFLPGELWINVGDSVVWTVRSGEIHTVTFLATGQQRPPFDPSNQQLTMHQGGGVYDGHSYFNSGIMTTMPQASGFGLAAKTYQLTFGVTGDFTYICLVHPGMQATIHVRPAGTPYPLTQRQYDRQSHQTRLDLLQQGHRLKAEAEVDAAQHHKQHLVIVGIGNDMVDVMRFFPRVITIHVGDTITFVNKSMGPHTVTFGPEQNINVPYGTPNAFDGTSPLNSGLLGPKPPFGGTTFSVTFTHAGRFPYICALHDYLGMTGTVVVTR
jgi:plastocyanin